MRTVNEQSGIDAIGDVLNIFWRGWLIMLVFGALSQPEHLDISELAIGYWTSVLVNLLAGLLFNQITATELSFWKGRYGR